jgi:quinol monooxygenase YgiN
MIVISGLIVCKPSTFDEVFELSIGHTQRSRAVPGCEMHTAHIDAENGLRIVFLEHWSDRASVLAHFADQRSKEFIERVRELAAEPPRLQIIEGEEIAVTDLAGPASAS